MCETVHEQPGRASGRVIPLNEAVGTVLAHDITEIRPGEFKGRAFKKGHVVRQEDVGHLQRLGKEHVFVLEMGADEMHEDDAAYALAEALIGEGVQIKDEPKEGKITLVAGRDGLFRVDRESLLAFNMLGDIMCATVHGFTVVKKGQAVGGTRAIPLVVKKTVIAEATRIGEQARRMSAGEWRTGILEVREMRRPKAGMVITGNEVYHGRIKDRFAPVIKEKIRSLGGEVMGTFFAPDDESFIEARLRELIDAGADLLITTGGMSVDPDDVTRFAIRKLGATEITYGSPVLPGSMILVAYLEDPRSSFLNVQTREHPAAIPVVGIPACGMYSKTTVLDLILPRILAGEKIGRNELAALGHGGLCLGCEVCRYPVCPFGKA